MSFVTTWVTWSMLVFTTLGEDICPDKALVTPQMWSLTLYHLMRLLSCLQTHSKVADSLLMLVGVSSLRRLCTLHLLLVTQSALKLSSSASMAGHAADWTSIVELVIAGLHRKIIAAASTCHIVGATAINLLHGGLFVVVDELDTFECSTSQWPLVAFVLQDWVFSQMLGRMKSV